MAVIELFTRKARALCTDAPTMGEMELALEKVASGFQLAALQALTQQRAAAVPAACTCGTALRIESHATFRTVNSHFGEFPLSRLYGYCHQCTQWIHPADAALGLHPRGRNSPRVQEVCALTALDHPAVYAQEKTRRLTGINLDASSIHREARRQGDRAIALREVNAEMTQSAKGIARLSAQAPAAAKDSTLVIEIDAWLIRERDQWGETAALRRADEKITRWHWVYTATIFRLDQRATKESGRPVITDRAYVATRLGLEAFRKQLYAEALLRGAAQAKEVLVLGDGAAWIWNIAQDRFKDATHRVDLYHVNSHLWAVAHDLFGQDSAEARAWVAPYISWLKNRKHGARDVINDLAQLLETKTDITPEQRENLQRELGYFDDHKDRMAYKQARLSGQPMGSGAIESTCSQYQSRFKLRGQFWSIEGDEAFLALWTLHHNGRWADLFPHENMRMRLAA